MRLMYAAAISLSIGLLLAFADDKKKDDSKASREDRFKDLSKKYESEMKELGKRFSATRDPSEQKGIMAEAREATILASRDMLKLAEENTKDRTAFNVAVFILEKA